MPETPKDERKILQKPDRFAGIRHRPLTLFRHKSQADAVPIRPETNDQ